MNNFKIFIVIIILLSLYNCRGQTAKEYFKHGLLKDSLKDYKGAIVEFSKAIKIDSQNSKIFYDRALDKGKINDLHGSIID